MKININNKSIDLSKLKQFTCVKKEVEEGDFVNLIIHTYEQLPEDQFSIFTYDMNNNVDRENLKWSLSALSSCLVYGK